MRATEFIVEGVSEGLLEAREGTMREIIRKILPTWPEYVIKDWISSRIKNQEDLKNLTGWLVDLNKMVEPNSCKLHQKMFLTFDMLNPRTRYSMKTKRQFGARNPFLIPRDEERNANAEQLVKTKGMENLPPVTMIQHSNGLELCEGWHRTMAAFRLHPEGFYVNAWIGQAGQQGIAEGLEHADKLSGLVDLPVFPSSTNPRGTAKVVNTGDRIMAVLNVRGVNIPYYISTGGGGKASVPTGKWYPVFGIHSSGWLNKGTEESINKFYGSKELARGAEILNKYLGDLRSVEDKIPLMKPDGYLIINKNVKPRSWHEVDSNVTEFKKRINAVLVQIGDAPHYPEVEYSKNDKKSQIVHLQNLAKFYPNITMKDFVNQGKEKIINDAMLEVNQLKNYYGQNKQANFVQLLSNLENDINSFKRGSLANTNNQNSVPNLSLLLKGTLGKINFSTP